MHRRTGVTVEADIQAFAVAEWNSDQKGLCSDSDPHAFTALLMAALQPFNLAFNHK